jgi:CheY-like chemotaxis protein
MPNVDGYEFVAELRKRGFDGPVVGISAAVVGEETDKLIESGADAVLSKPINMGEFEQLLKAEAERIQYFDGSAGEA